MASHTTDPVVVEADRRVEQAKASLRARIAVLERRLGDVRDSIDLPAQIRRHPLPSIGVAFALGALIGGRGRRSPEPAASTALTIRPRSLTGAALALASALGLQLLRELAFAQVMRAAERWWSEQTGPVDEQTGPVDEHAPAPDFVRRPGP